MIRTAATAIHTRTPTWTSLRAMNTSGVANVSTWTNATAAGVCHASEITRRDAVCAMGSELWNSNEITWPHWSVESLLMIAGSQPAHQTSSGTMARDVRAVARL